MSVPCELVDNLIFDGLRAMAAGRFKPYFSNRSGCCKRQILRHQLRNK
jgi:hypothetical protein